MMAICYCCKRRHRRDRFAASKAAAESTLGRRHTSQQGKPLQSKSHALQRVRSSRLAIAHGLCDTTRPVEGAALVRAAAASTSARRNARHPQHPQRHRRWASHSRSHLTSPHSHGLRPWCAAGSQPGANREPASKLGAS